MHFTKTTLVTKENAQHDWYIVDAEGKRLGRLAVKIATALMGKNKPTYTRHIDTGDYVIVVNAEKIVVTGNKLDQRTYATYSGYPGGLKTEKMRDLLERRPTEIIRLAVKRMLPKGTLGKQMFKKLKVYAGPEHEHIAQMPKAMDI